MVGDFFFHIIQAGITINFIFSIIIIWNNGKNIKMNVTINAGPIYIRYSFFSKKGANPLFGLSE